MAGIGHSGKRRHAGDRTPDKVKGNEHNLQLFSLSLLDLLLRRDGWRMEPGNRQEDSFAGSSRTPSDEALPPFRSAAIFTSADGRRRLFVLFDHWPRAMLDQACAGIAGLDRNRFRQLPLVVINSLATAPPPGADKPWRRVVSVDFAALDQRCAKLFPGDYQDLRGRFPDLPCPGRESRPGGPPIASFTAEVLDNVMVGQGPSPYRKLRFKARQLSGIQPGQFIMAGSRPAVTAGDQSYEIAWSDLQRHVSLEPHAYLKRPFGIHRAFHPGFPADYLRRLRLPGSLLPVARLGAPDTFDLFFKVLPHGLGTGEMSRLAPGDRFEMTGPLGRPVDLARVAAETTGEVHVIGGGVGMAPLVFLVQSLRFLGIPVRAFVGMESVSAMRYPNRQEDACGQDPTIERTFEATAGDAHIYIDDLREIGVPGDRIHLSCDLDEQHSGPVVEHSHGTVCDLYRGFLEQADAKTGDTAFACGPMPMMRDIYRATAERGIKLYVLMEKRMACGIGVCLSCVCRTGKGKYARVCREGPVFAAEEIEWNE